MLLWVARANTCFRRSSFTWLQQHPTRLSLTHTSVTTFAPLWGNHMR